MLLAGDHVTDGYDRRTFLSGAAGAVLARGGSRGLLARLPGPPMLSAGVIARKGDGRAALRVIDGMALHDGAAARPIRFNDPFRVASVSKMVTATGFMRLVNARAIDLDGDVSGHLGGDLRHPDFPDIAITPRMLLSHTSGLRNGANYPVPFGNNLLDQLHAASRPADRGGWFSPASEPPGAWFAYADFNFGVIAQVIECVTGRRFDRYMHDTLFAPLSLDIGYNWSGVSQPKRDRAAPGARWLDGRWTTQVDASPPRAPDVALFRRADAPSLTLDGYRPGQNGLAFAPHGGLRLSLADMDALAGVYAHGGRHRGTEIIAPAVLASMQTPAWTLATDHPNGATEEGFFQRFGLGVHLPVGGAGSRDAFFGDATQDWRGHFGDAYGWMTGLFWNARDRSTLVFAINGMPETNRPPAPRSAITSTEQALIDGAIAALR